MITIINQKNFDPDQFVNIDLSENIILCTNKIDKQYLKENLDGSLSIKLDKPFNLLGEKVYSTNNLVLVNYRPRLKIACPRGLVIDFYEPINTNFIFKLNIKYNINQYYTKEEEILRTTLPNVIIYEDFNIDIIVDLNMLKLNRDLFMLQNNEELVSFKFTPIYYPGEYCQNIKEIKNIYWFQHNELYTQFKKNI